MALGPKDLRRLINRYTPGNSLQSSTHEFQRVAIQVFGFLGHGKSSLINSCLCVLNNVEYENVSGAGMTQGGLTTQRHEHGLTNTLVMIDNRGFSKLNPQEILEACAQIRSLRDIGEVTWDIDNLNETLRQFPLKYQNRPADFILPVLVYSAAKPWNPSEGEDIQKFISEAFKITGIHPIVVITKCASENYNNLRKNFGELGATKRLCLENYTENDYTRTEEKDGKFLEFLHVCIQEAERGIKIRQNQDNQTRFVIEAVKQIQMGTDLMRKELKTQPAASKNRCSPS
ncbi:uncharacterized protein [Pyxicephalus adspersus]|uniref:uncharacterized protein n=1 Tax=Pyxicephalus adspersus TaxID=30357 RepID=UPI003B5BF8AB